MLLAIILSALYATVFSQKRSEEPYDYYVKTTNIDCVWSPEWIENGSCSLKPVNWEKTFINAKFDIKRPIQNFSFHLQIFRRETRYVPFLLDLQLNGCDVFNQKKKDFKNKLLLKLFSKFTTLNLSCPIKVGHAELKNFYFDSKLLPLPVPPGMYKFKATFFAESLPHTICVLQHNHIVAKKPAH